jgi:trehalose synthase
MRLAPVEVGTLSLRAFEDLLDPDAVAKLRAAERLAPSLLDGHRVWNVNSTARGGGVAELLTTLLAYAKGVGIDARWVVVTGDASFFLVTKRLHNRLHGMPGDGGPLHDREREIYEAELGPNGDDLRSLLEPGDVVILHDPQTAGLIPLVKQQGNVVVWRCHIGLDTPNALARDAWRFLEPYVRQADAYVFSRDGFVWDGLDRARLAIIAPSIDAFAPKNQPLDADVVRAILSTTELRTDGPRTALPFFRRLDGRAGQVRRRALVLEERMLGPDDRLVLQVSRWDRLKDPIGVIDGFARHVAPASDAHLMYAGPVVEAVSDDPEGASVLAEAQDVWRALPEPLRQRIHLALLPYDDPDENAAIVNALQRSADVVVQKSLAEGFGLTVAEAMWKGRPVVGSDIGGIRDQIEPGVSGLLLSDPTDLAGFGAAVLELLDDPDAAARMAAHARERVRERYLGTHSLLDYLDLLERLL